LPDRGPGDRSAGRRFAIYFAPPVGSPLAKAGARWLGRDALTGTLLPQPRIQGLSAERLAAITAGPRHYGFHATLKAPFSLVEDKTAPELHKATARLAAGRRAFSMSLCVGEISGFLALVPARAPEALAGLEAVCVQEVDRFRAPEGEAEAEKRRAAGLSARQEALLGLWGYPYVLEEFRFHMTLTERLEEPERGRIKALLQGMLGPVLEPPVRIDSISVFEQPGRRTPFAEIARHTLRG
jgi:putative phosphonate metabolism protein